MLEASRFSVSITFPDRFHSDHAFSRVCLNRQGYEPQFVRIQSKTWRGSFIVDRDEAPARPGLLPLTLVLVFFLKKGQEQVYSQEAYAKCPVPLTDSTRTLTYRNADEESCTRDASVQVSFQITATRQAPVTATHLEKKYTSQEMVRRNRQYMGEEFILPILSVTIFPLYTVHGFYAPGWTFFSTVQDEFPPSNSTTWPFLRRVIHLAHVLASPGTSRGSSPSDLDNVIREWDRKCTDYRNFASYLIGALGVCATYRDDVVTTGTLGSSSAWRLTEKFERVLGDIPYTGQNLAGDCEDCLYLNLAVYSALLTNPDASRYIPRFVEWLKGFVVPVHGRKGVDVSTHAYPGYAGCLVDIAQDHTASSTLLCHATGILGPLAGDPLLIDSVAWVHHGNLLDHPHTHQTYERLYNSLQKHYGKPTKIKREISSRKILPRTTISELFLVGARRLRITTQGKTGFAFAGTVEGRVDEPEEEDQEDTYVNQFHGPAYVPEPTHAFSVTAFKQTTKVKDTLTLLALDVADTPPLDFSASVSSLWVVATGLIPTTKLHAYIFSL